MISDTLTLATPDRARLLVRRWRPAAPPRGIVFLVHGLSEHSGRYDGLALDFCDAGLMVIGHDQRGHGRSSGLRGHVADYQKLLDDIDFVRREFAPPGAAHFLYGQSMGGGEVLNYALQRGTGLSGVIAASPLLRPALRPPKWKYFVGRYFANTFLPWLPFRTKMDVSLLSHDPEVGERLRNDPLWHGRVSARLGLEMFEAGREALKHAAELSVPTLLMHGSADVFTSFEASRTFAERAGAICTFLPCTGLYHELHHEAAWPRIFAQVRQWLETRLATPKAAD